MSESEREQHPNNGTPPRETALEEDLIHYDSFIKVAHARGLTGTLGELPERSATYFHSQYRRLSKLATTPERQRLVDTLFAELQREGAEVTDIVRRYEGEMPKGQYERILDKIAVWAGDIKDLQENLARQAEAEAPPGPPAPPVLPHMLFKGPAKIFDGEVSTLKQRLNEYLSQTQNELRNLARGKVSDPKELEDILKKMDVDFGTMRRGRDLIPQYAQNGALEALITPYGDTIENWYKRFDASMPQPQSTPSNLPHEEDRTIRDATHMAQEEPTTPKAQPEEKATRKRPSRAKTAEAASQKTDARNTAREGSVISSFKDVTVQGNLIVASTTNKESQPDKKVGSAVSAGVAETQKALDELKKKAEEPKVDNVAREKIIKSANTIAENLKGFDSPKVEEGTALSGLDKKMGEPAVPPVPPPPPEVPSLEVALEELDRARENFARASGDKEKIRRVQRSWGQWAKEKLLGADPQQFELDPNTPAGRSYAAAEAAYRAAEEKVGRVHVQTPGAENVHKWREFILDEQKKLQDKMIANKDPKQEGIIRKFLEAYGNTSKSKRILITALIATGAVAAFSATGVGIGALSYTALAAYFGRRVAGAALGTVAAEAVGKYRAESGKNKFEAALAQIHPDNLREAADEIRAALEEKRRHDKRTGWWKMATAFGTGAGIGSSILIWENFHAPGITHLETAIDPTTGRPVTVAVPGTEGAQAPAEGAAPEGLPYGNTYPEPPGEPSPYPGAGGNTLPQSGYPEAPGEPTSIPIDPSRPYFEMQTFEVHKGDTVWGLLKTQLMGDEAFKHLTTAQQNNVIANLTENIRSMSPDQMHAIGIASGNPDLIHPGEHINFAHAFDQGKTPHTLSYWIDHAQHLPEHPVTHVGPTTPAAEAYPGGTPGEPTPLPYPHAPGEPGGGFGPSTPEIHAVTPEKITDLVNEDITKRFGGNAFLFFGPKVVDPHITAAIDNVKAVNVFDNTYHPAFDPTPQPGLTDPQYGEIKRYVMSVRHDFEDATGNVGTPHPNETIMDYLKRLYTGIKDHQGITQEHIPVRAENPIA